MTRRNAGGQLRAQEAGIGRLACHPTNRGRTQVDRQVIAIRVDPSVLESFRKEARRRRVGYQTLINEVLAEHIRKDVA